MKKKIAAPRVKWGVRKDDVVRVLSGDDRGKQGKILQVLPRRGMALVEGVNLVTKHVKKTQERPEGGRVPREAPIRICKLKKVTAARAEKKAE